MKLNIKNETSRLRAVILGTAESNGPVPSIEEAYDPKSLDHIKSLYVIKCFPNKNLYNKMSLYNNNTHYTIQHHHTT